MKIRGRVARLVRRVTDDFAADVGWQGFTHRGIRILHSGELVDQQKIAARLDEELERLGPRVKLLCIRRIRVYVSPNRGTDLVMAARWTGGLWDRGEARVEGGEDHVERVVGAVLSLVGIEQELLDDAA